MTCNSLTVQSGGEIDNGPLPAGTATFTGDVTLQTGNMVANTAKFSSTSSSYGNKSKTLGFDTESTKTVQLKHCFTEELSKLMDQPEPTHGIEAKKQARSG